MMMQLTLDALGPHLAARVTESRPRIVVSGNVATPTGVLTAIADSFATVVIHALNAQPGLPDRPGVTMETCFVGPGMRTSSDLVYIPARLSMVPKLFTSTCPPDIVLIHTTPAADGKVSLGVEVNILPSAIEAARARGGVVVAAMNPNMPYTFGDAEINTDLIDLAVDYPKADSAAGYRRYRR